MPTNRKSLSSRRLICNNFAGLVSSGVKHSKDDNGHDCAVVTLQTVAVSMAARTLRQLDADLSTLTKQRLSADTELLSQQSPSPLPDARTQKDCTGF